MAFPCSDFFFSVKKMKKQNLVLNRDTWFSSFLPAIQTKVAFFLKDESFFTAHIASYSHFLCQILDRCVSFQETNV
jgi:hypothetical protein